jgi:hypothetical protein
MHQSRPSEVAKFGGDSRRFNESEDRSVMKTASKALKEVGEVPQLFWR